MSRDRNRLENVSIHCADWLSSLTVASLTLTGEAIYLRLLMHQWLSQGQGIPDDERTLRQLTRSSAAEWRAAWAKLAPHFPVVAPGFRRNPRMHGEYEFSIKRRRQLRENGRRGGLAKSKRRNDIGGSGGLANATPDATPDATAKSWQTRSKTPSPSLRGTYVPLSPSQARTDEPNRNGTPAGELAALWLRPRTGEVA